MSAMGDWWLILPDRRMILWRYESVSGLLGHKKSEFHVDECTDIKPYPVVVSVPCFPRMANGSIDAFGS